MIYYLHSFIPSFLSPFICPILLMYSLCFTFRKNTRRKMTQPKRSYSVLNLLDQVGTPLAHSLHPNHTHQQITQQDPLPTHTTVSPTTSTTRDTSLKIVRTERTNEHKGFVTRLKDLSDYIWKSRLSGLSIETEDA